MRNPHPTIWLAMVTLLVAPLLPMGAAQIGNEAPTVTIETPPEGATVNGTVEVAGNASDPDGNVSRVEVRIDQGEWTNATGTENWSFSWDTTGVSDGTHTISARSYDGQNHSSITERNVTVDNNQTSDGNQTGDTNGSDGTSANQPPSLTIDSPAPGSTVNGTVAVEGSASDPDGNLSAVQVRVDDGPWSQAEGKETWRFSWDTSTVDPGEHTVTVQATDDDGSTAEAMVNVTVEEGTDEAVGPNVTIVSPNDGATVNGTVEIQGTASDPDGSIDSVELRIDHGPWEPVQGTQDWGLLWDATKIDPGEHTLRVRAFDDEGNQANASVNVTVEETEPLNTTQAPEPLKLAVTSPQDGTTTDGNLTIAGEVQGVEDQNVTVRVSFRIDNGSWRVIEAPGGGAFEQTVNVSDLPTGEHEIEIRAVHGERTSETHHATFEIQKAEEQGVADPQTGLVLLVVAVLAGGGLALWARR